MKTRIEKIIEGVKDILGSRSIVSKDNAITNKEILKKLTEKGISANSADVRQAIHHIRITYTVPNLIAGHNGYYVSNDYKEIDRYINSLLRRMDSMGEVARSLIMTTNVVEE